MVVIDVEVFVVEIPVVMAADAVVDGGDTDFGLIALPALPAPPADEADDEEDADNGGGGGVVGDRLPFIIS